MAEGEIRIKPDRRGGPAAFFLGGATLLFFPAGAVSFSGGLFPSQAFFLTAGGLLALCALRFLFLSRREFPVLIRLPDDRRELQVFAADGRSAAISGDRFASVTVERSRRSRYSVGLILKNGSFFYLDSFLALRRADRFRQRVEAAIVDGGRGKRGRRDEKMRRKRNEVTSSDEREGERSITRIERGSDRFFFWSDRLTWRGVLYLNALLLPALMLIGVGVFRARGGSIDFLPYILVAYLPVQITLLVYGLRLRRLRRYLRITEKLITRGRFVGRRFPDELRTDGERGRPREGIAAVLLSFEAESGFSRILFPDARELQALRSLRESPGGPGRTARLLRTRARVFALPLLGLNCVEAIRLREILEHELKTGGQRR